MNSLSSFPEPTKFNPNLIANTIAKTTESVVSIRTLDPKKLSESEFFRINSMLQEMWSSENGLQELTRCYSCDTIFSKKDIFGHLEAGLYNLPVNEIMKILGLLYISCPCCKNKTHFIYGTEEIYALKKRLLESVYSFLVIAEKEIDMVGGLLWYMPNSFQEMYDLEFKSHYSTIGVEKIRNKVTMILDIEPTNILMFAAIGFLDKYRNLFQLIEFLQLAFENFPKKYYGLPAIMELDKNNTMHKLFMSMGGVSLDLGEHGNESGIKNTGKNYRSDIVVLPNATESFGKYFGPGVSKRTIFKQLQSIKNT